MPASTAIKATPPSNENDDAEIATSGPTIQTEITGEIYDEENLARRGKSVVLLLVGPTVGPIFCQQGGIRSSPIYGPC